MTAIETTSVYSRERWLFDTVRRYCIDGIREWFGDGNDHYRIDQLKTLLWRVEHIDAYNLGVIRYLESELLDVVSYEPSDWFSRTENSIRKLTEDNYARFVENAAKMLPDYNQDPLIVRQVLSQKRTNEVRLLAEERWKIPVGYEWFPFSPRTDSSLNWFSAYEFERLIEISEIKRIISRSKSDNFYWINDVSSGPGPNALSASYRYISDSLEQLSYVFEYLKSETAGFWCDDTHEWIIYLTWKGTMTVGGTLAINSLNGCLKFSLNFLMARRLTGPLLAF